MSRGGESDRAPASVNGQIEYNRLNQALIDIVNH